MEGYSGAILSHFGCGQMTKENGLALAINYVVKQCFLHLRQWNATCNSSTSVLLLPHVSGHRFLTCVHSMRPSHC